MTKSEVPKKSSRFATSQEAHIGLAKLPHLCKLSWKNTHFYREWNLRDTAAQEYFPFRVVSAAAELLRVFPACSFSLQEHTQIGRVVGPRISTTNPANGNTCTQEIGLLVLFMLKLPFFLLIVHCDHGRLISVNSGYYPCCAASVVVTGIFPAKDYSRCLWGILFRNQMAYRVSVPSDI